MNKYRPQWFCILSVLAIAFLNLSGKQTIDARIASCTFDPKTDNLQLYWKDDSGKILRSISYFGLSDRLLQVRDSSLHKASAQNDELIHIRHS